MNVSRIFINLFFVVFFIVPINLFREKKIHFFVKQDAGICLFYKSIAFTLEAWLPEVDEYANRYFGKPHVIE